MGFDIYGNAPATPCGKYFGASGAGWRELWDFCVQHSPDAVGLGIKAYYNDFAVMPADGARRLAQVIRERVEDGTAAKVEAAMTAANPPETSPASDPFGVDAQKHGRFVRRLEEFSDFAYRSGGFSIT